MHIFEQLGVCTLTLEGKWDKPKPLLRKWLDRLEAGEVKLTHKELLSDQGFLVYVARTYPSMIPYLKGFHLTIKMWRGGRGTEGWKLKEGNNSSLLTTVSLDSLEDTRAGAHGKNLGRVASYNPNTNEDEDAAAIMDHMLVLQGEGRTGLCS